MPKTSWTKQAQSHLIWTQSPFEAVLANEVGLPGKSKMLIFHLNALQYESNYAVGLRFVAYSIRKQIPELLQVRIEMISAHPLSKHQSFSEAQI
jgi:hypothetical protein